LRFSWNFDSQSSICKYPYRLDKLPLQGPRISGGVGVPIRPAAQNKLGDQCLRRLGRRLAAWNGRRSAESGEKGPPRKEFSRLGAGLGDALWWPEPADRRFWPVGKQVRDTQYRHEAPAGHGAWPSSRSTFRRPSLCAVQSCLFRELIYARRCVPEWRSERPPGALQSQKQRGYRDISSIRPIIVAERLSMTRHRYGPSGGAHGPGHPVAGRIILENLSLESFGNAARCTV
jgi:hypothetical protein